MFSTFTAQVKAKKITKWIFKNQYFVQAFAMSGLTVDG